MARITDYDTLKTAVSDYLARSDLSGWIPNFIQNCESKIYRSLNLKAMEAALSVTITSGVAAVPADYKEMKYAYLNTSPVTWLEPISPEDVYSRYPVRSATGKPLYYSREASNFIFGPYPDSSSYTMTGIYYKYMTALSSSNTTNWFITNAPELLLYGALLEAEPFLKNDARMQTWSALFQQAYDSVRMQEKRERYSGGSLVTRPA